MIRILILVLHKQMFIISVCWVVLVPLCFSNAKELLADGGEKGFLALLIISSDVGQERNRQVRFAGRVCSSPEYRSGRGGSLQACLLFTAAAILSLFIIFIIIISVKVYNRVCVSKMKSI